MQREKDDSYMGEVHPDALSGIHLTEMHAERGRSGSVSSENTPPNLPRKLQVTKEVIDDYSNPGQPDVIVARIHVVRAPGKPTASHWEKRARDDPVKVLMSEALSGEETMSAREFLRIVSYCTNAGPVRISTDIPSRFTSYGELFVQLQMALLELGINII